jgi:hypothetical protein
MYSIRQTFQVSLLHLACYDHSHPSGELSTPYPQIICNVSASRFQRLVSAYCLLRSPT